MKIILNVAENYNPNDGDILVYEKGMWRVKHLSTLFASRDEKIKSLNEEVELLKGENKKITQKFDRVLEIIKEVKAND